MIKDILQSIPGVEIFPIIALLIMLTLFIAVVWFVIRLDKKRAEYYSSLPLDDKDSDLIDGIRPEENHG